MRTRILTVVIIISAMFLSGCGLFGGGASAPVDVVAPINVINQNQEALDHIAFTIKAHKEDYTEEELMKLRWSQGALLALLEYAEMISTTGTANYYNVKTVWEQAQIQYFRLHTLIRTDTWDSPDRIIFSMVRSEARRLSAIVDASLVAAKDKSDRATMDAIISQILALAAYVVPVPAP